MNRSNILSKRASRKIYFRLCALSALFTVSISLLFFAFAGLAPFGNRTLSYSDGQFQIVDLLGWYKDVLMGKSSIDYTFTKSLGGSNFAVFTYYLASPFTLLIIFFNKSSTPLFMNILFVLKSTTAAVCAAYYLIRRFRPSGRRLYASTIALSVSYALCSFFISQSSNIMWLDGAYMLPLILAGCEKIIESKHSTQFSVTVALAICFNWYTGIIDLMFACFWLLFEIGRKYISRQKYALTTLSEPDCNESSVSDSPSIAKEVFLTFLRYAIACVIALLLSAAILLPTLLMLTGRTHGSSGLAMLKDVSMIGTITDAISNYSFGTISVKGSASLFAGSFVLIGVALLFIAGRQSLKEKFLNGLLLLFAILMHFWQPLVALFSMLRIVESYWYRYSYLGCFILVLLAGEFYLKPNLYTSEADSDHSEKTIRAWLPFIVSIAFCAIVFLFSKLQSNQTPNLVFALSYRNIFHQDVDLQSTPLQAKMIFPLLTGLSMSLSFYFKDRSVSLRRVFISLLSVVLIVELTLSQIILSDFYTVENANEISEYYQKEGDLLQRIDTDSSYRITQTTYHSLHNDFPASYNEPMAFGFRSLVSFVSDPDEDVIFFLEKAGYPQYSETISVNIEENLALDSLLHVKYILLDDNDSHITGLQYLYSSDGFKSLYMNPYCAPEAFIYQGTGNYNPDAANSFEYLNLLYQTLSGIDGNIFTAVEYSESLESGTYHYQVNLDESFDEKKQLLYACLCTNTDQGATLSVNGETYTEYASFLAPQQIRLQPENCSVCIDLAFKESKNHSDSAQVTEVQFYLLDLDTLARAIESMQHRACTSSDIQDGSCCFEASGSNGESLFISVPYEDGWIITRNGKEIEADRIGGSLISIPLEEGDNVIEMAYKLPFLTEGLILSIFGIVMLAAMVWAEKHFSQKEINSETIS